MRSFLKRVAKNEQGEAVHLNKDTVVTGHSLGGNTSQTLKYLKI